MSIFICLALLSGFALRAPMLGSPLLLPRTVIQESGQEGFRESVRRSNAAFAEAIRLYKGGALQAAIHECDKAIACATVDDNPMRLGTDRAYRLMSRIRLDQGRNQEALDLILKATDMEDDFDRALAYLRVGNMAQARANCSPEMLRRGISTYDIPDLDDPQGYEAAILYKRLSLGVQLDDVDLPIADLRKCLELVPTFAGAANALAARLRVEKKNPTAAIPYYFLVAKFGHGGMVREAMRYLTDEQVRQAGGREALLARAGQE